MASHGYCLPYTESIKLLEVNQKVSFSYEFSGANFVIMSDIITSFCLFET